ncbi:helicase [Mycobacterium sp. 1274756.6]|nr:Rv3654c family TadE-like protein [Mycobacterium sp. 1274756.6]OBJ70762.1 helicase [Mycobacterium sp. 1274756.6]
MVVVLLTVTGGIACLGSVIVARHRAQAAADLAALAAAGALPAGPAAACSSAAMVVDRMRATLAGCRVENLEVVVAVRVPVPLVTGGVVSAATARAGPAGR